MNICFPLVDFNRSVYRSIIDKMILIYISFTTRIEIFWNVDVWICLRNMLQKTVLKSQKKIFDLLIKLVQYNN